MYDEAQADRSYDPDLIARYFDVLGEREWQRFERSLFDRVSLEIHSRLLAEFVHRGDRVLDAGAGPGRFTIQLAALGARIVVGDISEEQLRLHREKVAEAGGEERIEARELLDITDLSRFADESFDAVVCYGGPLSYVRDRGPEAVAELARVVKHEGYLLVSVMSALGATRIWLDEVLGRQVDTYGLDPEIASTGHTLKMYRFSELERLLLEHGFEIVAATAANFLSARTDTIELDEGREQMLLARAYRPP